MGNTTTPKTHPTYPTQHTRNPHTLTAPPTPSQPPHPHRATHTPLPFLIHDSAIIKLVGHAPVRELLSVYMQSEKLTSRAGEPKQVFFSFDATKAYGQRAEELVEATRVIHLGDGTRALYGFTWNTETTEESN